MDSLYSDGTTEHVFSFVRCSVHGAPRITPILQHLTEGDPLLDRMDRMSAHRHKYKNRSPTLSIWIVLRGTRRSYPDRSHTESDALPELSVSGKFLVRKLSRCDGSPRAVHAFAGMGGRVKSLFRPRGVLRPCTRQGDVRVCQRWEKRVGSPCCGSIMSYRNSPPHDGKNTNESVLGVA